jgi:glycosyltransferase involved in cell wall biosynthesis
MSTISILTPAYRTNPDHWAATVAGVRSQQLPPDTQLEWVIQEDGPATLDLSILDGLPVRYEANGRHLGVATTRNIALIRANGELLQNLDHDDVLLPYHIETLARHFSNPDVHWAVGQADDLNQDGSTTQWSSVLPYGVLPAGMVNRDAADRAGNWQIHAAGMMYRTELVRALGGWIAGHGDDDLLLMAAVTELAAGVNDPRTTWLYRQHSGQLSKQEESIRASVVGRQAVLQRVLAIRVAAMTVGQGAMTPRPIPTVGAAHKHAIAGRDGSLATPMH